MYPMADPSFTAREASPLELYEGLCLLFYRYFGENSGVGGPSPLPAPLGLPMHGTLHMHTENIQNHRLVQDAALFTLFSLSSEIVSYMEDYEGLSFERKQNALTKKRNQISCRPRTASLQACQVSSDDYKAAHSNPRTKQFNLSQRTLFGSQDRSVSHSKIIGYRAGYESKNKRVKLKVGSVTRTIETKDSSLGVLGGNLSQKSIRNIYPSQLRPKLNLQSSCGNRDSSRGKMPDNNALGHQGDNLVSVCKSKRLRKKRVLDGEFDEADEDDEIRYLKRLKTSKNAKPDDSLDDLVSSRSSKGNERSRSERGSEGTDWEADSPFESKQQELGLTTRQQALLSGRGGYSLSGASEIEFPNGLPPAPPKKQKEKLSETEQQLKKAVAAQRRRVQNEKAVRESEAEAIRKILDQDSNRKKREDKMKKRMDDLAQEKAANALMLASNTVRWVMGASGTVVTFSKDRGLPSNFNRGPCSYPAPRESCAVPSCTKPY